jgi:putative endonuclease
MAFFVYILHSIGSDRFYIGQTKDVNARVERHNLGYEKSTAPFRPWRLILYLEKDTRGEALVLERKLKNLSKSRLISFIEKYGSRAETSRP